jgi:diacylglycerol kinase (ATP)
VHETRSMSDLEKVARQIGSRGADAVVLAGGDGTYMAATTALSRAMNGSLPALAFAPGGTVSTVARNWGYSGTMVGYATRLLEDIAAGRAERTPRPTLRVTDDRGGDRTAFIWGAGLVSRFFEAYYAQPHAGYVGAARIVARIFVGSPFGGKLARRVLTPVRCTLTLDGELQTPTGYSLLAASVVRDLGLHMHVLHRAGEDPERLHIVGSPLGAPLLGPQLPLVLAGRRLMGAGHVDALAREVVLRFAEDDSYVLDGEVFAAREVTVSAGPRIEVLSPR